MDFKYVDRLLPLEVIPPVPTHDAYPTASGWQPPQGPLSPSTNHPCSVPPPALPYFIRRRRDHLPGVYLETRRDRLNHKTMDFDYVEVLVLDGVSGDVFVRVWQMPGF